ncbi:SMC-Scp complex subunit ScpB [Enterococcus columbae]|uniref:Segregation and condensation protein B n=1 Tax=Enterococcus columbae DSM 7374 = ATCC 51263 TaxID=1121865 RepID=S1NET4_9ENTE|nr:SMC-Scp complex subunit ScpB [Enterococcus columbae]EOT42494.1 segregation and condensation protein B [Enterococcus columbae DSM 7374 = ATCC 51263]EOW87570.1 segregation and condensation protein B [Enterococcus columbae DSM 7374 = ATCC 51263]OJG23124.1 segregation and condensation protein B [Enterococcus columbae DSM 7374 = ATCC 51263]
MSIISQIEALLFVAGDEGTTLDELGYLLKTSTVEVYQQLERLNQRYLDNSECAIEIKELGNRFMLTTKKQHTKLLKRYAQSPMANRLSQAALETLAVIAYKQPITRLEVDQIRGVNSSASIQKLVSFQLIEETGRLEAPGRPRIYGTTQYFMDYFGLRDLKELPDIQEMELDLAQELPNQLFKEVDEAIFHRENTEELKESDGKE